MSDSFAYITEQDYEQLCPLACQLFPPFDAARDYLVETTLDSLDVSPDTLKNDFAYQYIEFRDRRKLGSALSSFEAELGKGNQTPKLELTRNQLEDLKRYRKRFKEASQVADRESENKSIEKYDLLPPRFSKFFYLSREAEEAVKPKPLPSLDSLIPRLSPTPGARSQALAQVEGSLPQDIPSTQETIVSKYAATRAHFDPVRQHRKHLMNAIKESTNDKEGAVERARQEIGAKREILHDLLIRERSPSPEPFSMSFSATSPPSPESPELSHTSDSLPSEDKRENSIHFDVPEEQKSVSMEAKVTAEPTKVADTSTLARTSLDDASQLSETSTEGLSHSKAPQSSSIVANKFEELQSFRLSSNDLSLASFDSKSLDSIASLAPSVPAGSSNTVSYSLEWNPLSDTSKIPIGAPTTLTPGERSKAQDVFEAAEALFDSLMQSSSEWVNELRATIEMSTSGQLVEQEEEDSRRDAFEFFDKAHSTTSHDRVDPSTPDPQTERDRTATYTSLAPSQTPPGPSPSRPSNVPQSPFPPPYTLYKRRANSLPPPSSCSQLLFDSPPTIPVEFNGKQVETDEFGFAQLGSAVSSPTSSPLDAQGGGSSKGDIHAVPVSKNELERNRSESERAMTNETKTKPDGSRSVQSSTLESTTTSEPLSTRKAFDPFVKLASSKQEEWTPQLATPFRLAESLDRFIVSRGRPLITAPSRTLLNRDQQSQVANATSEFQAASAPSPVSLPFPTPPFVSSFLPPFPLPILRVIVFDPLLQMRSLSSALEKLHFQLGRRPSRFPPSRFTIQDPHLIISGTSCVFYFKLIDLIGNAMREDPPDSTKLTRQESIFSTLRRFSSLYDHILVIFEEQQASRKSSTSVKPYSYTPIVLEGLVRLAEALGSLLAEGKGQVHVVCSSGAEYSAEVTRKFAEFVKREDENETRPGIPAWGDRAWLSDDPQPDEPPLLKLSPLLNEMIVCAILSVTLPDEFVKLSQEDLESTFSSVCGNERLRKIWFSIHSDQAPRTLSFIALQDPPRSPSNSGSSPLRLDSPCVLDVIRSGDLRFEDVFDVDRYNEDSGMTMY